MSELDSDEEVDDQTDDEISQSENTNEGTESYDEEIYCNSSDSDTFSIKETLKEAKFILSTMVLSIFLILILVSSCGVLTKKCLNTRLNSFLVIFVALIIIAAIATLSIIGVALMGQGTHGEQYVQNQCQAIKDGQSSDIS